MLFNFWVPYYFTPPREVPGLLSSGSFGCFSAFHPAGNPGHGKASRGMSAERPWGVLRRP